MIRSLVVALFVATAAVQNPAHVLAQPIYAQNQIPARGAAVEYPLLNTTASKNTAMIVRVIREPPIAPRKM